MELIIFILATYGLTNIIVNESILERPIQWLRSRNMFLNSLLGCATCLAFYIGVGMFFLIPITLSGILWLDILLAGIIASGAINLIELIKIRFI